jgi:hypothetical protein
MNQMTPYRSRTPLSMKENYHNKSYIEEPARPSHVLVNMHLN